MFRQIPPSNKPFFVANDKNGKPLTLPLDQIYSQDFMLGSNGFPMNDITAIVRSQNVQEMNSLLAQCAQLRMKSPDNKDKSDEELLNELHPRHWQTPSEVMEIAQQLAARHLAKMAKSLLGLTGPRRESRT